MSRLRQLGVHVTPVIELANLMRRCDSQIDDTSLCALSHKYLGPHIQDKDMGQDTRLQLLFSATSKEHSALCSCGRVTYKVSNTKNVDSYFRQ